MAKVTLSFEITGVNEDDSYEVIETVKGILNKEIDTIYYEISDIKIKDIETDYEEDEDK